MLQGDDGLINQAMSMLHVKFYQQAIQIQEDSLRKRLKKAYLLTLIGQVWDNQMQKDTNLT